LIAYFLSSISAKYYENPTMLSRVIAKNIGDVFLSHTVQSFCRMNIFLFLRVFSLGYCKFDCQYQRS